MAHSRKSWDALVCMADVDIALLQEASRVPDHLHDRFEVDERLWPESRGVRLGYPSVVARLSDRVDVSFIETRLLGDARGHNFYTSEWGTLAAAIVTQAGGGEPLTVVSMAPCYNSFTRESGSPSRSETIGSVHRLISDLARLVGRRSRVIAAGRLDHLPGLEHTSDGEVGRTRSAALPDGVRPDGGAGIPPSHA